MISFLFRGRRDIAVYIRYVVTLFDMLFCLLLAIGLSFAPGTDEGLPLWRTRSCIRKLKARRSESLSSSAFASLVSSMAFLCCSFFSSRCSLLISSQAHLAAAFSLAIWPCSITISSFIPSISVAIVLHLQGQASFGTFWLLLGNTVNLQKCAVYLYSLLWPLSLYDKHNFNLNFTDKLSDRNQRAVISLLFSRSNYVTCSDA